MKKFITALFISSLYLLSKLPFVAVQRLGQQLGKTLIKSNKRTVKAIDINLNLCLPEKSDEERYAIREARLKHMGQTFLELSHLWILKPQKITPYLKSRYDNALFEEALKTDQGVIFLTPHLGNWEVLINYLGQFRTPTFMYSPQKDSEKLDSFIFKSRQHMGAELAPANIKGVTQIMKLLKRGGVAAILPDQTPKEGGGVYAPFYGHQAYTMTLAHKLAQKTNAKVFMGAAFQVKGGYEVLVEPIDDAFYSDDLILSATALNKSIENIIRYHPEQYQWEYKRFKKQPNEKRMYPKG